LQNQIVQELRKDPLDRSCGEIAADVQKFGIGPGQAQAVTWKGLIDRLQELGR
jgi:hypothetical protein